MDTEKEDAITDAALDGLTRTRYAECPGCLGLIHHSDVTAHARKCAPLRAWAEGQV